MAKASRVTKKIKFAGRPAGAPNKSNLYPRNENCKVRCSGGFNEVLQELAAQDRISKSDVLHKALQQFAYQHEITDKLKLWINKIV